MPDLNAVATGDADEEEDMLLRVSFVFVALSIDLLTDKVEPLSR